MEGFDGEDPNENTTKAVVNTLSALPLEILYRIMEHLTLEDAARMSALSSHWRKIWSSVPSIAFDYLFVEELQGRGKILSLNDFNSACDRVLLHHKGPILKFTVEAALPGVDVSPWLAYVSESVREFAFSAFSTPLKLSSHLFSCSALRILKLCGCTICVPPTFTGFSHLVTLEIVFVKASGDVFGSLIHKSLQLEELVLRYSCEGFEDIVIDSPLLRHLYISGKWNSIRFENAPNLAVADLNLEVGNLDYKKARTMINFLASSCSIKKLHLGAAILRPFLERDTYEKLHTFDQLTYLGFKNLNLNNSHGLSYVKSMMRSCPNMTHVRLIMDQGSGGLRFFESGHDHILEHLQWIEIVDFTGLKTEIKLIEFLLQNSPKLVTLHVLRRYNSELGWKLAKELMRCPRASSKAEILFHGE